MNDRTITITLNTDNAMDLLAALWYSLQRLESMGPICLDDWGDIGPMCLHDWGDVVNMTGDEALNWVNAIYNEGLVLGWMIDKDGITQPCLRG
jgi:hypothetical protein